MPDKYLLLRKFRPRDINLNLGAGNYEGQGNLLIQGMTGFGDKSTLSFNQKNNKKHIKFRIVVHIIQHY